jgi:polyferredoxin
LPRYRLWVLGAVNGLILLHILCYYFLDRRSIGCVDFFGLATFFGNGQITAGTIFLVCVVGVTLVFGRVFCGWGCHFALFQDLLVRFLTRLGVRTPFRRSRLEYVVPPILFLVTLLYPIAAWWQTNGLPREVTMELAYPEVWHLLPGLKGVVLILLVDVVLLTVLFGSRAFCRYVCPYGLFLKFFHAFSPFRVVKTGNCSDCGACARACPTGVPIKYETERFGVIRDLNCMNCGDCVATCPSGALSLRPTRRAYSLAWLRGIAMAGQPVRVELVLFFATIGGLVAFRGREYGDFLAAGMGLVIGAVVVGAFEPARFLPHGFSARFSSARQYLVAALTFCLVAGMVGQTLGLDVLRRGDRALKTRDYGAALAYFETGSRIAVVFRPFTFYLDDFAARVPGRVSRLEAEADKLMTSAKWHDAELVYRAIIAIQPDRIRAHGNLGTALFKQGRYWDAGACYLAVLEHDPNDLVALYHLAMTRIQLGELDDAAELVVRILDIDTVGNAYDLIRENPIFRLLDQHPGYRRVMAVYQSQRAGSSHKGEMNR